MEKSEIEDMLIYRRWDRQERLSQVLCCRPGDGIGRLDTEGRGSGESLLLVYPFPGSTRQVCVPSECLQVLEAGFLE